METTKRINFAYVPPDEMDMTDDETMREMMEGISDRVSDEIKAGTVVLMDCTCPNCGEEWTTPINSSVEGITPNFDVCHCKLDEDEEVRRII